MRFIGTIEAKVDSKGRVFMPATFRRTMQEAVANPMGIAAVASDIQALAEANAAGRIEAAGRAEANAASRIEAAGRAEGNAAGRIEAAGRAEANAAGRIEAASRAETDTAGRGEMRLIMRKDVFEDCLVIYTEDVWYARLDELQSRLSIWNRKEQAMLRKFVTDAEWLSLDASGRFLIPKRYLKMAGIEGSVTFVGMDSTIEVWSKERLAAQQSDDEFALNIESHMNLTNDR